MREGGILFSILCRLGAKSLLDMLIDYTPLLVHALYLFEMLGMFFSWYRVHRFRILLLSK